MRGFFCARLSFFFCTEFCEACGGVSGDVAEWEREKVLVRCSAGWDWVFWNCMLQSLTRLGMRWEWIYVASGCYFRM